MAEQSWNHRQHSRHHREAHLQPHDPDEGNGGQNVVGGSDHRRQAAPQRLAFHVLSGHEVQSVILSNLMNGEDVRMIE